MVAASAFVPMELPPWMGWARGKGGKLVGGGAGRSVLGGDWNRSSGEVGVLLPAGSGK